MLLRRLLLLLRQLDAGKEFLKQVVVVCLEPFLAFRYRRLKFAVLWWQRAYAAVCPTVSASIQVTDPMEGSYIWVLSEKHYRLEVALPLPWKREGYVNWGTVGSGNDSAEMSNL